jgi:hypothetical protein
MNDPVPRTPGWRLIANSSGTQGWHLIESTTPERGVKTLCGITGRAIDESHPVMVLCQDCQARLPG